MKRKLTGRQIVILASIALLGMGLIQLNWVWTSYQLKREEVHHDLSKLTPQIAVQVKIQENLRQTDFLQKEHRPDLVKVQGIVDSMTRASGFEETVHFAFLQQKENGLFLPGQPAYREALVASPYKTCISCIVTYRFLSDSTEQVTGEMTSIRPVEETERLLSDDPAEDFIWFAIHMPRQEVLSQRAIMGLFVLSLLMMGILVLLFSHVLRTLARQKKLSQMKDDFFNNLTHEFKTPLGAIRLAATVLRQDIGPEKQRTCLDLISDESKLLEDQVDRILQLSILEAGEEALEPEEVDLHQLIRHLCDRLKFRMERTGAHIELQLQLADASLQADRNHLSNAIYNLLDNALKYGGTPPKIEVRTGQEQEHRIIAVRDQGPGIPPAQRQAIFERFHRGQQGDRYKGQGFGIGLSYARAIIEAHGGSLCLNEAYREGSEFLIRF